MIAASLGGGSFGLLVVVVVGGLACALVVLRERWDRERIEEDVRGRGGRVISIQWAPFGRGWFGEKNDRIYEVVFYDEEGRQHFATAKTSMLSGVYWTEDRVSHGRPGWYDRAPAENEPGHPVLDAVGEDADPGDEIERLRRENAMLREALRKRGGPPLPPEPPAA